MNDIYQNPGPASEEPGDNAGGVPTDETVVGNTEPVPTTPVPATPAPASAPVSPTPAAPPTAVPAPPFSPPLAGGGEWYSRGWQPPDETPYQGTSWAPHQSWAPPMAREAKRGSSWLRIFAVGVAVVLLLGLGVGIGYGVWNQGGSTSTLSSQLGSASPGSSGSAGSGSSAAPANPSAIASQVDPGLVDINTILGQEGEEAAGTGMVVTSSGEVVTNNHVISDATSIKVTDIGNGKTYGATVVGYDVSNDIAVIQLQNASGLKTVTFGNSSNVTVGEGVVGIGNAGGTGGTPSAVSGTVTALHQSITASDFQATPEQLSGLIETDANIQPGDSGGPLVNVNGQVVGIDTAASEGFTFQSGGTAAYSIPINQVMTIAQEISSNQASATVHIGATPLLGVEVQQPTSSGSGGSSSSGGSQSQSSGAVIEQVVSGGPAAQAGISAGDVITNLGGKTITSAADLTSALNSYHPGNSVRVSWTDQSGQTHSATVQLSSRPPL